MVPASGTERISLESAEKMQEMHRNPQGNIVNQRNTEAVFRTQGVGESVDMAVMIFAHVFKIDFIWTITRDYQKNSRSYRG